MSGWIKIEKDLFTDPRVRRVARLLFCDESCNAGAFQVTQGHLTHVVGALCKLWSIADTHCDQSNVMDGDVHDLNDMIGIPNFCESLPDEWFEDLGGGLVKFPAYQEHNGSEAKKKLQTARRVEAHRKRKSVTEKKEESVTSNAGALPDQDQDQDQDQDIKKKHTACAKKKADTTRGTRWPVDTRIPAEWIEEAKAMAKGVVLDLEAIEETFVDWWIAQPGQKGVKVDWRATWRNWIRKEVREINGKRGNGRKATGLERAQQAELEAGRAGRPEGGNHPVPGARTINGEVLRRETH